MADKRLRKPLIAPGSYLPPAPEAAAENDVIARIVQRDRERSGRASSSDHTTRDEAVMSLPSGTSNNNHNEVTTRLQVVETTGSPISPAQSDYKTTGSHLGGRERVAGAVGGKRRRGERKRLVTIKRPRRPATPEQAQASIRGMVNSEHGVINFRGPKGLNERIDEYLAEHFRDKPQKQDYIARALALIIYEMETGTELVHFEDGDD